MSDDKEERIRAEAYRRWEQEGRPDGQHDRHWHEAAEAIEADQADAPVESEGTTQASKVLKPRAAAKPKAEKPAKAVEEKAPKASSVKITTPAALAAEVSKPPKSRKAIAAE